MTKWLSQWTLFPAGLGDGSRPLVREELASQLHTRSRLVSKASVAAYQSASGSVTRKTQPRGFLVLRGGLSRDGPWRQALRFADTGDGPSAPPFHRDFRTQSVVGAGHGHMSILF